MHEQKYCVLADNVSNAAAFNHLFTVKFSSTQNRRQFESTQKISFIQLVTQFKAIDNRFEHVLPQKKDTEHRVFRLENISLEFQ